MSHFPAMINDVCDMMEMGTSTERTVGPYSYAMYSSCFSVHPIEVGPIHKYSRSPDVDVSAHFT